MNCPNCKNPIKETATFCEWCGAGVAQSQTNQTNCEYKLSITAKKQLFLWQATYTIIIDNERELKIKGGENKIVSITRGSHNIEIRVWPSTRELMITIEKDAFISLFLDKSENNNIDVKVGFAEYFLK